MPQKKTPNFRVFKKKDRTFINIFKGNVNIKGKKVTPMVTIYNMVLCNILFDTDKEPKIFVIF